MKICKNTILILAAVAVTLAAHFAPKGVGIQWEQR